LAMAIHKFKSSRMSPTFEMLNLERWNRCLRTTELAKRLIGESKKLTRESQELLERLRQRRKDS